MHNAEISKQLGTAWKRLSPDERLPYIVESQRLKREHKLQYPDYKYRPRKRAKGAEQEVPAGLPKKVSRPGFIKQEPRVASSKQRPASPKVFLKKPLSPSARPLSPPSAKPASPTTTHRPTSPSPSANSRVATKLSISTKGTKTSLFSQPGCSTRTPNMSTPPAPALATSRPNPYASQLPAPKLTTR